MNSIIVCTDFSVGGNNAASYAAMLAEQVKATLTVVHFTMEEPTAFSFLSGNLLPDSTVLKEQMAALLLRLHNITQSNITIHSEIIHNRFSRGMLPACKNAKAELVVLGARRNSPVAGLFGGKAIYASKHMNEPLLIVPEHCHYKKVDKIGLASDLKNTRKEGVSLFKKIAAAFNASIHVLYAEVGGHTSEQQYDEARQLVNVFGTDHYYHTISSKNVDDDVMDYLHKQQVQILAVLSRKHGLLQRLLHFSHTSYFIRFSNIPVLVLQA